MNRFSHIRNTWHAGHYGVIGVIMFFVLFIGVIVRNVDALFAIYAATGSIGSVLRFFLALLGGISDLLSPFGAIMLIIFGLLFGLNTVLLLQYIRRKRKQTICITYEKSGHAATISGTVASIFGIGCAACGSAILLGVLNVIGAGGLLLLLPLEGAEFSIFGTILLAYATWVLLGKMAT